jgi:uncharacterized membrane protein YtjA (UPF0391 family)
MIYSGLLFFLVAIVSGLCGFSGMLAPFPAHIAQTVFASSQVLPTLIFAARLLRPEPARSDPAQAGAGDERELHLNVPVAAGGHSEASAVCEQTLFKAA